MDEDYKDFTGCEDRNSATYVKSATSWPMKLGRGDTAELERTLDILIHFDSPVRSVCVTRHAQLHRHQSH